MWWCRCSPAADWDAVRDFAHGIARAMEADEPDRFVSTVPKAKRRGRILVDWLRNGAGATAICSYSPRARPGATVATPLAWREVTAKLDPAAFTIATVPQRLARQKQDPWAGFAAAARPLPKETAVMAEHHQRPIWRGHLRLALVSCPIALNSVRQASAELHFHFINPKTGNRVRMVTLDAGTEKEVERSDLVKGYEFKKDTYVLLDDADFERAKIDSSTVLNIDKFVPAETIDPVYYDTSYFMLPDGEAGEDVYAVLREAIGRTGKVALSRLVIARRERSVAVMPLGKGLVVHTLVDPKELHDPEEAFAELAGPKPDAAMVKLATQLVERQPAASTSPT